MDEDDELRGARARTHRAMVDAAAKLMKRGATPSVTEVSEAAGVSRATAYRYFPTQADLVDAVVGEAFGPLGDWQPTSDAVGERVSDMLGASLARVGSFESTFRSALKLSLEPEAGGGSSKSQRVGLVENALAPLRKAMPRAQFRRLAQAISLVSGVELMVVVKDLWGGSAAEARSTAQWMADTLVAAALKEAGPAAKSAARSAAKRPAAKAKAAPKAKKAAPKAKSAPKAKKAAPKAKAKAGRRR